MPKGNPSFGKIKKRTGEELEKWIVSTFTEYLNRPILLDSNHFIEAVKAARDYFKFKHNSKHSKELAAAQKEKKLKEQNAK